MNEPLRDLWSAPYSLNSELKAMVGEPFDEGIHDTHWAKLPGDHEVKTYSSFLHMLYSIVKQIEKCKKKIFLPISFFPNQVLKNGIF